MKEIILIFIFTIISIPILYAQQETVYSQYMLNLQNYNPAFTGMNGCISLNAQYRKQWEIPGGPKTMLLNAHGMICRLRSGIGLGLFRDQIGAFMINKAQLSYAYHLPISKKAVLSLGLYGGIYNTGIDHNKIKLANTSDPTYTLPDNSVIKPDVGFGISYYRKNLFMGFSLEHLLEPNLNIYDSTNATYLYRNYYLSIGYDYHINNKLSLSPSLFYRHTSNAAPQLDANIRLIMLRNYWVGIGYRTQDAIVINVGFDIHMVNQKKLRIGYSYDLTTSNLAVRNTFGSHELLISYQFGCCQKKSKKGKALDSDWYTKTPENF